MNSESDNLTDKINWIQSIPVLSMHILCLGVFFVGFSWVAFGVCILFYWIRAFGITGVYHRYFAHKTYKTSRIFQFFLALLGTSAAQMGPLWWAGHHRKHHRYSDTDRDVHSPVRKSFYWAHIGWILSSQYIHTDHGVIQDFARYPELRFLNRFHMLVPAVLATFMFWLGEFLALRFPSLQTSGLQMLIWGFFISTVFLYHCTFLVNSLAHVWGSRRFETSDESRNNLLISILTLGEGWHNNHHRYPQSERQGFYWWEIDVTHYILSALARLNLVWDLQVPPKHVYDEALRLRQEARIPKAS